MIVLIVFTSVACALVATVPAAADLRRPPAAAPAALERAYAALDDAIAQFEDAAAQFEDAAAQFEHGAGEDFEDASQDFLKASAEFERLGPLFQGAAADFRRAAADFRRGRAQFRGAGAQFHAGAAQFRRASAGLQDVRARLKYARVVFLDAATVVFEYNHQLLEDLYGCALLSDLDEAQFRRACRSGEFDIAQNFHFQDTFKCAWRATGAFDLAQNTVDVSAVRDILYPGRADRTIDTLNRGLNSEGVTGCNDTDDLIRRLAQWHFQEDRNDFIQQCRYLGTLIYSLLEESN